MIKGKRIAALICVFAMLFSQTAVYAPVVKAEESRPAEAVQSEPYKISIPLIIPEAPPEGNETGILTATDERGYTVTLDLKDSGLKPGVYDVELNWVKATEAEIQAIEAELSEEMENGIRKVAHLPRDIDIMLLDISIIDTAAGTAIEPEGPVQVTISKDDFQLPTVVHFKQNGQTEQLEPDGNTFETDSFSSFFFGGVGYTVDFAYEGYTLSFAGKSTYRIADLL